REVIVAQVPAAMPRPFTDFLPLVSADDGPDVRAFSHESDRPARRVDIAPKRARSGETGPHPTAAGLARGRLHAPNCVARRAQIPAAEIEHRGEVVRLCVAYGQRL